MDHLHASPVLAKELSRLTDDVGETVLLSPDVGNVKAANQYATWLGGELAIIDKRRKSGSEVVSAQLIGDVNGKTVIMVDDMITTAGTICEAAKLVKEHGARDVICAATHPVLVGLAIERIGEAPLSKLVVTDTIPCNSRCKPIESKLSVLSVADLLGEAIHRIHHNQSVSSLFSHNGRQE